MPTRRATVSRTPSRRSTCSRSRPCAKRLAISSSTSWCVRARARAAPPRESASAPGAHSHCSHTSWRAQFLEREKLNAGIAHALDDASQPWGIRVYRYEIADIHVDRGTREAMEKQSNAERLRRAEVLESQGFREKMINQSEGKRQGAINQAQGEAESIRLRATAQAEEIKLLAEANAMSTRMAAEATADGLRSIAAAVAEPGGQDAMVQRLAERYVVELAESAPCTLASISLNPLDESSRPRRLASFRSSRWPAPPASCFLLPTLPLPAC
jgi:regulator of protease activity HflC (stomatin/prohibitin superfamily)